MDTPEVIPDTRSAPRPGSARRLGIVSIVIVMGLMGLLAVGIVPRLHQNAELSASAQAVGESVRTVNTVSAHLSQGDGLLLPGNTQAIEETAVSARTSGYLRRRFVDIGSRVKAGQVLAVIESPEVDQQLAQARADAAKSQAQTGQARADIARLQAGVLQSQTETARLQANVEQARAQLAGAQAKLAQSRATVANSQARLAQARQVHEQRKADLAQAQAQQTIAAKTLKRWQQLIQEGAVAAQELDEKQATYDANVASVSAAQAAVSSAQADVEAAQQTVNASLADVEAAQAEVNSSRQNIQAALNAVRSSQANIQAAQASVQAGLSSFQASVAAVGSSQANVQRYAVLQSFQNIVAPFDGVITARNVDTGALIDAGNAGGGAGSPTSTLPRNGLFGIARVDVLRIQVNVPQTFALSIRPGQTAQVLFREFPGRTFTGTVSRVSGALDSTSRTLPTEIRLRNGDGLLRPGMDAQVHFAPSGSVRMVRIPATTLIVGTEGTRIATVTPDHRVHYLPVGVGRDFGTEVEIREGLKGNEVLIANPATDLKEGDAVHPVSLPQP